MSIDLTLDRIREVSKRLPAYTRPTCHIAGTNGKGSVAAILSSILHSADPPFSVGRFNSPHLISVHDSISIDGEAVALDVYTAAKRRVETIAASHGLSISSFETLTLTALQIFEQAKVDVVVLEVGMGGRLDATNVISDDTVLISALTCVDLDHQAFLGDTISVIAREKVGIARRGKTLILGPQKYSEVIQVAQMATTTLGAELLCCDSTKVVKRDRVVETDRQDPSGNLRFPVHSPVRIAIQMAPFEGELISSFPLHGDHQIFNLQLALTIISTLMTHTSCSFFPIGGRITAQSITEGVSAVVWYGRMSMHTLSIPVASSGSIQYLTILADGAHNPGSSAVLADYVYQLCSRLPHSGSHQVLAITYIIALSDSPGKDHRKTLSPLLSDERLQKLPFELCVNIAPVKFSQPDGMPWVRHVLPTEIGKIAKQILPAALFPSISDDDADCLSALRWAALLSKQNKGPHLVVVAGSLYLVSDLYRIFSEPNVFGC